MQNSYKPEGSLYGTAENNEFIKNETGLYTAMRCGAIVESVALSCGKDLELIVDLCGIKGVIKKEEAVYNPDGGDIKDIAVITRVGKPVCFKILDIRNENGKKYAVLSRAEAQKECVDEYLTNLLPGDIINCRITHLEKFGAFADIGCGVAALLPIDCISVSRISHSADRLKRGQNLRCVVRSVQKEPFRMFLSLKELLGTWEENAENFSPGQTVCGIVRGIEPYGVFIELAPNLSGLSEYRDDVTQGDEAAVYIKSMDKDKMKIKLVVINVNGKAEKTDLQYFVPDDVTHIYDWIYSTPSSNKVVRTEFE